MQNSSMLHAISDLRPEAVRLQAVEAAVCARQQQHDPYAFSNMLCTTFLISAAALLNGMKSINVRREARPASELPDAAARCASWLGPKSTISGSPAAHLCSDVLHRDVRLVHQMSSRLFHRLS